MRSRRLRLKPHIAFPPTSEESGLPGSRHSVIGQDLESNRIYMLQVIATDNSITERSWLKAISDKPAWIEVDEASNMEYWNYSTRWSVCPDY